MNLGRGGFKLPSNVEKPDKDWRGKNLWALKVDLFLVIDISKHVHIWKYLLYYEFKYIY